LVNSRCWALEDDGQLTYRASAPRAPRPSRLGARPHHLPCHARSAAVAR